MAKNSKNKKKTSLFDMGENANTPLGQETKKGIVTIVLFLLGLFFLFAAIGIGGSAGSYIHTNISRALFGYGFFFLPIFLIVLGVMNHRLEGISLRVKHWLSSLVLLISFLAIFDIVKMDTGGFIGSIARPFTSLFDVYFSSIIFIALIVISLLILFEAKLGIPEYLKKLFTKKEEQKELSNEKMDLSLEKALEESFKDDLDHDGIPLEENPSQEATPKKKDDAGLQIVGLIKRPGDEDELQFNDLQEVADTEYTPPPLSLLQKSRGRPSVGDIKANANTIRRTLQNFGISVEMDEVSIGPTITRYALKPAEGVRLNRIVGLQKDLELALAAHPVRIEAPIPGKSLVGIEIPNRAKTMVGLGTILADPEIKNSDKPLTVPLGKGVSGISYKASIAKMPHMLIAGATGAGKSVTVHSIIISLLYNFGPRDLRFIMVDPKRVELTLYNNIPHLYTPVIKDPKLAIQALKWAGKEMERRYDLLEKYKVRDIGSYHENILKPSIENNVEGEKKLEHMPYIVVIIDELADIMQAYPRELEAGIVRLAQMSRAVGIHLILSTQRPSVNVITGLIKANIPTRLALQVASQIDSRTILDSAGAEKLLGAGDMLYMGGEMNKPVRVQSPFISEQEVKAVVEFIITHNKAIPPDEISFGEKDQGDTAGSNVFEAGAFEDDDDTLFGEAKLTVISAGKASTSYLQRKFKIGYSRAARLMDLLEERGVIGPSDGAKPRKILVAYQGLGAPEEETNDDDVNTEND